MLGRIIKYFAYSAYFTVAVVMFAYWSIPTDKVSRFLSHQATAKMKLTVKIDGLTLLGINGATLNGVTIELPIEKNTPAGDEAGGPGEAPTPGADAADDQPATSDEEFPGMVMFKDLTVSANTIAILRGKDALVDFSGDFVTGGTVEGSFAMPGMVWPPAEGKFTQIGMELAPTRLFEFLLGKRIEGRMSLDSAWSGFPSALDAKIDLTITDGVIPYLPIPNPRPMPGQPAYPLGEAFQVAIGEMKLKAHWAPVSELPKLGPRARTAKQAILFETISAEGDHIELMLDNGQKHFIAINDAKFSMSQIDLKFVVHFTDAFFAWKGDGERPDGTIAKDESHGGLRMPLENALKQARVKLGTKYYYGFHCTGAIKTMKCLPRAPSRRIQPKLGEPRSAKKPDDDPSTSPSTAGKLERPAAPSRPKRSVAKRDSRTGRRTSKSAVRPTNRMVEPDRSDLEAERRERLRKRMQRDEDDPPPPMLGGGGEITKTVGEDEDEPEAEQEDGRDEREEADDDRDEEDNVDEDENDPDDEEGDWEQEGDDSDYVDDDEEQY